MRLRRLIFFLPVASNRPLKASASARLVGYACQTSTDTISAVSKANVTVETIPTAQRLILTLAAKRSSGLCSFPEVQCCHLKEDEQRFLSSLGQHLHKAIDAAQLFRRQLRRR